MPEYEPPVDRLLTFRNAEFLRHEKWPDYPSELGLGPEHVGELIRMATDPELYEAEPSPEKPDYYHATIHARRALGQLKAREAVGPLLRAMERFGDLDDFWTEDLPRILEMVGPEAIPEVAATLNDPDREIWTRVTCSSALTNLARAHPESRGRCVQVMTDLLESRQVGDYPEMLNGSVVGDLATLKAVEAAEVIERAFEAGVVDPTIAGDWPIIRYLLDLGPKPPGYRTAAEIERSMRLAPFGNQRSRPNPDQIKKKLKAQKKARKRNRKPR